MAFIIQHLKAFLDVECILNSVKLFLLQFADIHTNHWLFKTYSLLIRYKNYSFFYFLSKVGNKLSHPGISWRYPHHDLYFTGEVIKRPSCQHHWGGHNQWPVFTEGTSQKHLGSSHWNSNKAMKH